MQYTREDPEDFQNEFASTNCGERGDEFWPPGVAVGNANIKDAAQRGTQRSRSSDSNKHG